MQSAATANVVDIVRIMELCRDIEMYNAELYKFYAEIFSADEEISKLWSKTALEEESHMNQIVMAIGMREQWHVASVKVDIFRAENTLRMVKSIYDGVRLNRPSLIDALRSAIKLEHNLDTFHMSNVATFKDGNLNELFKSLMNADREHIGMLESLYRKTLAANSK
jgi:rubrerythrin